jgi:3-deoxy-D-manno-octulosonate 8-phosphate phosphatase KdsC-like HAD superfamily phosphatase
MIRFTDAEVMQLVVGLPLTTKEARDLLDNVATLVVHKLATREAVRIIEPIALAKLNSGEASGLKGF